MHRGCAFSTLRYDVHEHEVDAGPRLSCVAATLNYPHPIFSHPGIIRGLRSPLSAAADSPHTHPVSFLYCLSSIAYTFITPWANSPSPHLSCSLHALELLRATGARWSRSASPLPWDTGLLAQTGRQYPSLATGWCSVRALMSLATDKLLPLN